MAKAGGLVFLAEQVQPVRRRVALKVLKLGMDTKSVIGRFEAERQALAMMDHPNIAKVLDAGATANGRPYFVMELVRGIKITDFCDEAKLSTQARLELFIQVCQAVQHAHQKGVIHRDLKPSNILVTVNDGLPVPKVIDFGIAKAVSGQQLTDKTVFTAFEQFIGTPAYMSPEQALVTSLDIDTRSDIYTLGVLLYELLTGKTPFDTAQLLAIGLDEMRRTIREQEPPRPSTRLSSLPGQELGTTAQRRGLDPPALVSELRGDLDWIVMKALEKERGRRYETANGLAGDVKRHLHNEAVLACPPSRAYRFRKLLRRHKLAFTAAAAVMTALVVGLAISTWSFLRERELTRRALAAERAERQLRLEAETRELNTRALQVQSEIQDPRVMLSAREKALEAQRKSLPAAHPDLADSLEQLARVYLWEVDKDSPEIEKAMNEALAIRRKNAPAGDLQTAKSLQTLAVVLNEQQKFGKAADAFREAVEIRRRIEGDGKVETPWWMNNYAALLSKQRRYAEALPVYQEAFAICDKILPKEHPLRVTVGGNISGTLNNLGRFLEAAEFTKDFVPSVIQKQEQKADLIGQVVFELVADGRAAAAEELLTEVFAKVPDHPRLLRIRGAFLARQGRYEAASMDYRRLVELDPKDDWHFHEYTALLASTRQVAELEKVCSEQLKRFKDATDGGVRERATRDALVVPLSAQTTQAAITLSETLTPKMIQGSFGWWFALARGLAEYRRGSYPAALEYLRLAAEAYEHPICQGQALPVAAMAHYRLGQISQAHSALASAKELYRLLKDCPSGGPQLVWHWVSWDWFRASALIDEASALIEGGNGLPPQ